MAGQFQVDLLGAGDLPDQLRLEHLQPGAKPDDDAAAHRVRSLLKQVEGAFGRVLDRQHLKHLPQFSVGTLGQQAVDLPDVALLRRVAQVYIQHQRLEQVHLGAVPKAVSFAVALGVLDDHVHKQLGVQLLSVHLLQTVPSVGAFRADQIEHADGVAFGCEVFAGGLVEFGLGIVDDQRFAGGHALQDTVQAIGAGLHAAADAVHRNIAVEAALLRHADDLAAQHPQNGAGMAAQIMDEFQYAAEFLPGHPAGCAVGAARRIGKVAVGVVLAVAGGEFAVQRQQRHRAAAQQKGVQPIREIQQPLQAGDWGKGWQRR